MPTRTAPESPVPRIAPSRIDVVGGSWVLHVPRFGEEGAHFHTYGQLTPHFEGLSEGRLRATRCLNPSCPVSRGEGQLWLPPRADCPRRPPADELEGDRGSARLRLHLHLCRAGRNGSRATVPLLPDRRQ